VAGESSSPRTMSQDDLLLRAAVLSVFDVDWIHPRLSDADVDQVADFLSSSCERVVDSTGMPRWRLRDDKRIRVLREASRSSLRAALHSVATRPDDLVQAALDQYLSGSLPPLDSLDTAGLSGVLQLERWVGEGAGLPSSSDVQARVDRMTLVEPLQRLVARGFFGRKDLLAQLQLFIEHERPPMAQPDPFLVEGVGGSGKSSALARFILNLPENDHIAVYLSFDRGWLIDGGPWALFDEIVRQVGAQLTERRHEAEGLRRQAQTLVGRASGLSGVASRVSQQRDPVPPVLLQNLAKLVDGRERVVVALDTLEELARRDESFSQEIFGFLTKLSSSLTQARVIAAGRSLPSAALFPGRRRPWPLTGLDPPDALQLLRSLTIGTHTSDNLLQEIVRLLHGNPLSLHLAADVLKRTGEDPTQLIAVAEGNVQGQLYSRLLEHIRDRRVRAVAHPGLVVRRLTPEIIREVLAEPCGIAPLDDSEAARIFWALGDEATLCEPSPDGDGALVHRQDVRTLMLPAIQEDSPGTTRAIHEAAVRYYEAEQDRPAAPGPGLVPRREELYHRLMLEQEHPTLDQRWDPAVTSDLAMVTDEFPPRSRLYLNIKLHGQRLDPAALAEADDYEWQLAVRPAAMLRMERGQVAEALKLVQERRASDGRSLLPDIEIEALERRGRVRKALKLAREERERASQQGAVRQVRALISQEARILERKHKWSSAWELLDSLAALDRNRRARTDKFDDEVRIRELVVLTSMLRIARNERRIRERIRTIVPSIIRIVRRQKRPDRHIDKITRETVSLAEATPKRLLTANPSLLRDLAAEIGPRAPEIFQLAASALTTPAGADLGSAHTESTEAADSVANAGEKSQPKPAVQVGDSARNLSTQFRNASDTSQDYLAVTHSRYPDSARDEAYTRSYRFTRLVVGFLGILLPILFIIGEAFFLKGGVQVRGSLSAYYHTSMQDIFVGGLCVIGFLLATYMAGEANTLDYWASLIAGIAVLGVAFFPTTRPGLPVGASACGSIPQPPGCSFVEQTLGEHQTAVIHAVCVIVFILFLAVLSFLFAVSEVLPEKDRLTARVRSKSRVFRSPVLFWIHSACALIILAAGAWAFVGAGIGELTRVYIGEVVSFWAFGVSWLVAGFYLTAPARLGGGSAHREAFRRRSASAATRSGTA
jgi:hypothetical protein